jgi:hypothetical protein
VHQLGCILPGLENQRIEIHDVDCYFHVASLCGVSLDVGSDDVRTDTKYIPVTNYRVNDECGVYDDITYIVYNRCI